MIGFDLISCLTGFLRRASFDDIAVDSGVLYHVWVGLSALRVSSVSPSLLDFTVLDE